MKNENDSCFSCTYAYFYVSMEHTFLKTWKFGRKIINFFKRLRSENDKTVLTERHFLPFIRQAFYSVSVSILTAFYALFHLPPLQPSSGVLRQTKPTVSLAV